MTADPIRLLIADDHPVVRSGIAGLIDAEDDMEVVAQAEDGRTAVEAFRQHRPDVTLMDLRLPDMSGIDTIIAIRSEFPEARLIVLTTFDGDVEIQRALEAGARGYLLKTVPPKDLVHGIRQVHGGRKSIPTEVVAQLAEHLSDETLTDRELDVLSRLGDGNRNRDIAEQLSISEETVKVHMKHIMEKLGATDRTQALAIAMRRGFIRL